MNEPSETTVSASIHLLSCRWPTIDCTTYESPSRPDGYPVLHLGPCVLWPMVEQLTTIRDAIDGWLAGLDGVRLSAPTVPPDAIC